jgi:hypothetical protein
MHSASALAARNTAGQTSPQSTATPQGPVLTTSRLGSAPVLRFFRPGPQVSAAELDVLVIDGVLQRVVADLYAPVTVDNGPGLRAQALHQLLSPTLRQAGAISGETAVWIYAGGTEPRRLHVITEGVYRRHTKHGVQWRIHQIPLGRSHVRRLEGVALTSPARTAADLLVGRGCEASRVPLDTLISRPQDHVRPGGGLCESAGAAPAGDAALHHRQATLRRLTTHATVEPGLVQEILSGDGSPLQCEPSRAAALAQLLAQCTSRRLPTVR